MSRLWVVFLLPFLSPSVSAETHDQLVKRLYRVGLAYKSRGAHGRAIEVFNRVIREDPTLRGVYYARGMSQVSVIVRTRGNRNVGRAASDLTRAIDRGFANKQTYAARGFLKALMGDPGGRGDIMRAARTPGGQAPLGYAALGWYATKDNEYRNAAWFYRQAYSNSPAFHPLRDWVAGQMQMVRQGARDQFRDKKTPRVARRSRGAAPYIVVNGKIDPNLNQEAMSILSQGQSNQRAMAAKALGAPGNDEAVSILIDSLDDEALLVRGEALLSLGRIGNPSAVRPIQTHLKDKQPVMRFAATRALGDIGSERARPALEGRLGVEKDRRVRKETKVSLKKIDEGIFNGKFDVEHMFEGRFGQN